MTTDLLARALRAIYRRRPFRPFWIEFFCGDRVLVRHPEAVDQFGDLFLYRDKDSSHRVFDGAGVCQLVELPPGQSAP
jgi:hypothetical protein